MTNNDKIKEEATHLLSKIKQFKRTCDGIGGGPKNPAPIDAFERELRLILMFWDRGVDSDQQFSDHLDLLLEIRGF